MMRIVREFEERGRPFTWDERKLLWNIARENATILKGLFDDEIPDEEKSRFRNCHSPSN